MLAVEACSLEVARFGGRMTIAHGPGWPVASVNLPNGFALGATTGYLAVRPISQGQSACAHGLRPHRWLRHRCNSCWPSRKVGQLSSDEPHGVTEFAENARPIVSTAAFQLGITRWQVRKTPAT